MPIRNYLTFVAKNSDDAEWDSKGKELMVPGGRSICELLKNLLLKQGFESSESVQRKFYGWEFRIEKKGESFWCVLQSGGKGPESWLVIFEQRSSFWQRLLTLPGGVTFRELLGSVDEGIRKNDLISEVVWFTKDEYERYQMK